MLTGKEIIYTLLPVTAQECIGLLLLGGETFIPDISTFCSTSCCCKILMKTNSLREGKVLSFLAKIKCSTKYQLLCSTPTKYSLGTLDFRGSEMF